jgi:hypothetical protein
MPMRTPKDVEPVIDQFQDHHGYRFITLDAMRGIAAISVMLFHYLFGTSLHMFTQAYYAVDFFFCLSGIILTHSYESQIVNGMRFRQYIKKTINKVVSILFYRFSFRYRIVAELHDRCAGCRVSLKRLYHCCPVNTRIDSIG